MLSRRPTPETPTERDAARGALFQAGVRAVEQGGSDARSEAHTKVAGRVSDSCFHSVRACVALACPPWGRPGWYVGPTWAERGISSGDRATHSLVSSVDGHKPWGGTLWDQVVDWAHGP